MINQQDIIQKTSSIVAKKSLPEQVYEFKCACIERKFPHLIKKHKLAPMPNMKNEAVSWIACSHLY